MFARIWNLVIKEFTQLFRDRLLAPLVLLGPLAELLMIAWSSLQGIDHLPTAVLDLDNSSASRALVVAMENTETFDPYFVENLDQVTEDILVTTNDYYFIIRQIPDQPFFLFLNQRF